TAGLICSDDSTRAIIGKGIRRNLELGRFLVAEAGVFVASVIDVKRSGSVNFAILDGGMSSFYRPMFTNQKHRVTVVGKTQKNETRCAKSRGSENHEKGALKYRLVGNTCTPLDVIGDEELPALMAGDLLAFENAGAYGYSMSMLDFISFDRPKEIMI
ncbi:MAG: hypothetical protein FWF03_02755, partial [Defluviitaleaceae bacterium]|nr:hypothetical protein [Defluviitaleaceae bacterium]